MEGILLGLMFLAFIFLFYALVIGGISKLFNVTIVSRTGQTKTSPEDVDKFIKGVKKDSTRILNKIKSISLQSHKKLTSNSGDIEKLSELSKLYDKSHISEEEFELLKNQVLRK